MTFARFFPLVVLLFAWLSHASAEIHADVTVAGGVTGTFRITLEHTKTPATVANFIRLATGSHGWLDLQTGAIRHDPFYNGVTFHRVVAGFVSQAGSRAGDGTDGPGYRFRDEIDQTLSHDSAYVVAMANSGPNTNGSQFYITAAAQPGLNGGYSVFGRVTDGHDVCDRINATRVNNERPVTPIIIQSITVGGLSLPEFNLDQPLLPKLRNANPVLKQNGSTFTLGFDRHPFSEYVLFGSTDLVGWINLGAFYYHSVAPAIDFDITAIATGSAHFYRIARVDYSEASPIPFSPQTIGGKTFTFTPGNFPFASANTFNAAGHKGTWATNKNTSGTIKSVDYALDPFNPPVLFVEWNSADTYSFDLQFLYHLTYTSPTGGTFSGQTNVAGYQNISGTFTTTP